MDNYLDAINKYKESIKSRKEDNKKLLKILEDYLHRNPEIRFNQALINMSIVSQGTDQFFEEPVETLNRVLRKKKY